MAELRQRSPRPYNGTLNIHASNEMCSLKNFFSYFQGLNSNTESPPSHSATHMQIVHCSHIRVDELREESSG